MCGQRLPEDANYCPRCGARTKAGKVQVKLEISKIEEAIDATSKFIRYISWALILLLAIPLMAMGFYFYFRPWEPGFYLFFFGLGLVLAISIAMVMERCHRIVKLEQESKKEE